MGIGGRVAIGVLAALLAAGSRACAWEAPPDVRPFRPLLYTESGSGSGPEIGGFEEWGRGGPDPVGWPTEFGTRLPEAVEPDRSGALATPEGLVREAFEALRTQDRARLSACFFDARVLAQSARMSDESAREAVAEMEAAALELLAMFDAGAPSDARPGGMEALLDAGQISLGRPRLLDGSQAGPREHAEMHWGSEIRMRLQSGAVEFTLRFPRILVGGDGRWRMAAAPVVDDAYRAWRAMGIHLKPELIRVDHSPLPFAVGNYWEFRVRRPGSGEVSGDGYVVVAGEGFRDEVTEVTAFDGYQLVRIRRTYDNPSRSPDNTAWLQTPLRVYECPRECVRRAGDLGWLLSWADDQVPSLVFPLIPGTGWGIRGETGDHDVFRVQPERERATVPAGDFAEAVEITRNTSRGRESRYVVRGIGQVMRRVQSPIETTLVELVAYRVNP